MLQIYKCYRKGERVSAGILSGSTSQALLGRAATGTDKVQILVPRGSQESKEHRHGETVLKHRDRFHGGLKRGQDTVSASLAASLLIMN